MRKIDEFRYNVLKKLEVIFDQIETSTVFREPNDRINTYMLNALHTDAGMNGEEVMGEYYFLPVEDENAAFHVFYSVLSLSEEVAEDKFEVLGKAANQLNFFLPVGGFVFNKVDGIMAFKYTCVIPADRTETQALEQIDGSIGLSLQVIDQYVDVMMELAKGQMTLDEFMKELPEAFFQ